MEAYYDESLKVRAAGGGAGEYVTIKKLTDIKLKVDNKEVDLTFLEDQGYGSTYKIGGTITIECNGYLDKADAGQAIINATQFEILDNATVDFEYVMGVGKTVTGNATVSALENSGGTDMIPIKFTLKVNGKPTVSNAA